MGLELGFGLGVGVGVGIGVGVRGRAGGMGRGRVRLDELAVLVAARSAPNGAGAVGLDHAGAVADVLLPLRV